MDEKSPGISVLSSHDRRGYVVAQQRWSCQTLGGKVFLRHHVAEQRENERSQGVKRRKKRRGNGSENDSDLLTDLPRRKELRGFQRLGELAEKQRFNVKKYQLNICVVSHIKVFLKKCFERRDS